MPVSCNSSWFKAGIFLIYRIFKNEGTDYHLINNWLIYFRWIDTLLWIHMLADIGDVKKTLYMYYIFFLIKVYVFFMLPSGIIIYIHWWELLLGRKQACGYCYTNAEVYTLWQYRNRRKLEVRPCTTLIGGFKGSKQTEFARICKGKQQ